MVASFIVIIPLPTPNAAPVSEGYPPNIIISIRLDEVTFLKNAVFDDSNLTPAPY